MGNVVSASEEAVFTPSTKFSEFALARVETEIAEKGIKFVFAEYCDSHGIQRIRVVPADVFVECSSKGFMMTGMSLLRLPMRDVPPTPELPYTISYGNFRFLPDLDSFKAVPWMKDVASVIVDPYHIGGGCVGFSPRHVARAQVERLKKYGFQIFSSLEYEFAVLDGKTLTPVHKDVYGHQFQQYLQVWDYLTEIYDSLQKMGLRVEQIDSEGGYGLYEFPIKPSLGLQAGDDGFWLKKTVREVSKLRGYFASFSSKPFTETCSASGHFNHSLRDLSGKMLFYDDNESDKMSKTMQHWLAGLIHHAPAMVIIGCPTASCIRRFVHPNRVTSLYPNWGIDNRTCSFRVKDHATENTYIENRIFGAGCNPYLALAANIAAGLDGIINELPLPKMIEGDGNSAENVLPGAHRFTGKLSDAIKALEQDTVLCDALGRDFIEPYLNVKRHECAKEIEAIESGDSEFYDREYLPYL